MLQITWVPTWIQAQLPAQFSSFQSNSPHSDPSRATRSHPSATTIVAPPLSTISLSVDQVQQLIAYLSSQLHQQSIDQPEIPSVNPSSSSVSHIRGNIFSSSSFSHSIIARDAWVIDIGATHHVCRDLSLFSDSAFVQNIKVTFPNGDTVAIDHIGIVKLSDTLSLHNVLFVPLFAFNLFSFSALTRSYNCCVNFLSNSCLIQDRTQGLTMGRVEGKTIFSF